MIMVIMISITASILIFALSYCCTEENIETIKNCEKQEFDSIYDDLIAPFDDMLNEICGINKYDKTNTGE